MTKKLLLLAVAVATLIQPGCATREPKPSVPWHVTQTEKPFSFADLKLSPELEDKILALDPEHVTEKQVREVLAQAPAPRIINIRGGIYPVYLMMVSFSDFLTGLGYPEARIRNPRDGTYSYSCYESAAKLAGMVAWYYEKDGLRPMIVGHSQGGMQAVKVLDELSNSKRLRVFDPLTDRTQKRYDIIDPLTGGKLPVVKVQVCYTTAVSAGGLTRVLPNQWDMTTKLRKIPDSTVDFTGFSKGSDPFGGDLWGYAAANHYHAIGSANVRNVRLPSDYNHAKIPDTRHLLDSQAMIDWINNYTPTNEPQLNVKFDSDSTHILWAADVWYSIKEHWVLELQRLIRAQRARQHAN